MSNDEILTVKETAVLLKTTRQHEVEVDTPAGVIKYKVLEISGSTNK